MGNCSIGSVEEEKETIAENVRFFNQLHLTEKRFVHLDLCNCLKDFGCLEKMLVFYPKQTVEIKKTKSL